jgi:hypothetical protein
MASRLSHGVSFTANAGRAQRLLRLWQSRLRERRAGTERAQ